MSDRRVRVFSTAFKANVVRRLEAGEALASVSKELGVARKLLYEWRSAWRRLGVAGLNRKRGRKPGYRALSDRPPSELALDSRVGKRATPATELDQAKAHIAELERVIGRQQVDLDFFAKPCVSQTCHGRGPRGVAQSYLRAHPSDERAEDARRTPISQLFEWR